MTKPRLTDRILKGIIAACAKADVELDADDAPHSVKIHDEVLHAWKWASDMVEYRARARATANSRRLDDTEKR